MKTRHNENRQIIQIKIAYKQNKINIQKKENTTEWKHYIMKTDQKKKIAYKERNKYTTEWKQKGMKIQQNKNISVETTIKKEIQQKENTRE